MSISINHINGSMFYKVAPGDVLVHGCNAQGVMGSGVANQIRRLFPEAYLAYKTHQELYGLTVGDVAPSINKDFVIVANAITQEFYGTHQIQVDYDAIYTTFYKILIAFPKSNIKFPEIGCGLGGGDLNKVIAIIERVAQDTDFKGKLTMYHV